MRTETFILLRLRPNYTLLWPQIDPWLSPFYKAIDHKNAVQPTYGEGGEIRSPWFFSSPPWHPEKYGLRWLNPSVRWHWWPWIEPTAAILYSWNQKSFFTCNFLGETWARILSTFKVKMDILNYHIAQFHWAIALQTVMKCWERIEKQQLRTAARSLATDTFGSLQFEMGGRRVSDREELCRRYG